MIFQNLKIYIKIFILYFWIKNFLFVILLELKIVILVQKSLFCDKGHNFCKISHFTEKNSKKNE